jgi:alpha-L-arabinofuranosidase
MTEWNWNGWWGEAGRRAALNSTFAKGIGAAGYLHALMRDGDVIEIGCQSMLIGNGWGIHSIRADATAGYDPYFFPTGLATQLYAKHHGDRLLALDVIDLPVYRQPFRMGGIAPQHEVALVDALASADDKFIYFHAINRRFDGSSRVTIDVSAFQDLTGQAIHHWLEGRLQDEPAPGQPRQVARYRQAEIRFDGAVLKVDLPRRTVSCIAIQRKDKQP